MNAHMKWTAIGNISDIPRRGARCVNTPMGKIAVFRTADDQVFAVDDQCPHKKGPLSQGIVHGTSVTCPLHNWVISLETGEAQGQDTGKTRTIPLKLDGEEILLGLSALIEDAA
jgi:nitrite reductase (NADH) small subunit